MLRRTQGGQAIPGTGGHRPHRAQTPWFGQTQPDLRQGLFLRLAKSASTELPKQQFWCCRKHNSGAATLIVATVTSRTEKKKYQPTHVLIAHNTAFEKPSVVQLEQIFTIDKSRIQRFLGQTTRHEMRRIEEALMNSLEINEWDRRNADE